MDMPVLKSRPEDFLVNESIALRLTDPETAPYCYVTVRKMGYTTFEAVAHIADLLSVPAAEIGYAGLKDEDAITEQYMSLPSAAGGRLPEPLTRPAARGAMRWIHARVVGFGDDPLQIGRLNGNGFRVVVRELSADAAEQLAAFGTKINHFFVNYYDTQRFGVPGGPKQTHLIGRALLNGDFDAALDLIAASGSAEGRNAKEWGGSAADFLARLDDRVVSFYLSSFASHRWNQAVIELLRGFNGSDGVRVEREGIPYTFFERPDHVRRLVTARPDLEYLKYRWNNGAPEHSESVRATVVQSQIHIGRIASEEERPGTYLCELSFFLPSGCYATTAVGQLFFQLGGSRTDDG